MFFFANINPNVCIFVLIRSFLQYNYNLFPKYIISSFSLFGAFSRQQKHVLYYIIRNFPLLNITCIITIVTEVVKYQLLVCYYLIYNFFRGYLMYNFWDHIVNRVLPYI
ncbi:hypothetical protein ABZP36_003936 [Zizania latifolia]